MWKPNKVISRRVEQLPHISVRSLQLTMTTLEDPDMHIDTDTHTHNHTQSHTHTHTHACTHARTHTQTHNEQINTHIQWTDTHTHTLNRYTHTEQILTHTRTHIKLLHTQPLSPHIQTNTNSQINTYRDTERHRFTSHKTHTHTDEQSLRQVETQLEIDRSLQVILLSNAQHKA